MDIFWDPPSTWHEYGNEMGGRVTFWIGIGSSGFMNRVFSKSQKREFFEGL